MKILPDGFESKIMPITETGCWIWTGSLNKTGYGQFGVGGKAVLAHRMSYELFKGPIPKGMHILHSCDNPSCVNPDHLFLGTHQDNMDDKVAKNRQAKPQGNLNGRAKLTEQQVKEIREKYVPRKYSSYSLAKEYGVSQYNICAIISNKSWKHI